MGNAHHQRCCSAKRQQADPAKRLQQMNVLALNQQYTKQTQQQ